MFLGVYGRGTHAMAVNSQMMSLVVFKAPKLFLVGSMIYSKAFGGVGWLSNTLEVSLHPYLRSLRPNHMPWP